MNPAIVINLFLILIFETGQPRVGGTKISYISFSVMDIYELWMILQNYMLEPANQATATPVTHGCDIQ